MRYSHTNACILGVSGGRRLALGAGSLPGLEGRFLRKAMVALTLRPGVIWSLNCGATSFNVAEARSRFAELQSTFSKVFGSFVFLP